MVRLPEHSHCVQCGDPCPEGDDFCSDDCGVVYAETAMKTRKKDIVFWVAVAVALGGLVSLWVLL